VPIHHSLWRVSPTPQPLREAVLPTEALLEDMIVAAPEILSRQWMIGVDPESETRIKG
jgi:hypothetical protein